jgi:hypothetical protein
MGITTVNGARRDYFGARFNTARPTGYKVEIFCDGQATKWTPNLANNEIWVDASSVFRQGINMGPTFQYMGAGTCAVYGSLEDRSIAQNIQKADYAYLAAAETTNWVQLGVDPDTPAPLAPGEVMTVDGKLFEVLRFVFAGGSGSVTITSM